MLEWTRVVRIGGRGEERRDEQSRRVGGTDTGATVLDGLVRDGELGEVVADHLGLDLNRVEDLYIGASAQFPRLLQNSRNKIRTHLAVVDGLVSIHV